MFFPKFNWDVLKSTTDKSMETTFYIVLALLDVSAFSGYIFFKNNISCKSEKWKMKKN